MLSYLFIEELFRNVLKESTVIQGRFFLSSSYGEDINSGNLEQVMEELKIPDPQRTVPLCVMMPPRSTSDYTSSRSKDNYDIVLLFLTGTYFTSSGDVKDPLPQMNKSGHKVTEDWHDMKRCAKNFMMVLDELIRSNPELARNFSISTRQPHIMEPISMIGSKNLSGVKLIFPGIVNTGCEIEDYASGYATRIAIPTIDTHPSHLH